MRNYIHGELSEWSKVQHSKCCVPKRNLGFESLTLRHRRHKLCIACDDFFTKNHPALTPLFLLSPKSFTTFRGPHYTVNKRVCWTFLFYISELREPFFRAEQKRTGTEQPVFSLMPSSFRVRNGEIFFSHFYLAPFALKALGIRQKHPIHHRLCRRQF